MSEIDKQSTLSGSPSGSAEVPRTESEVSTSDVSKKSSETDASQPNVSDNIIHAVRVACKEIVLVSSALSNSGISHTMRSTLEVAASREAGDMIIRTIIRELEVAASREENGND